jgi:hypothetical protein
MFSRNKVGEIKTIEVEFKLFISGDLKMRIAMEFWSWEFFLDYFLLLLGTHSRKKIE